MVLEELPIYKSVRKRNIIYAFSFILVEFMIFIIFYFIMTKISTSISIEITGEQLYLERIEDARRIILIVLTIIIFISTITVIFILKFKYKNYLYSPITREEIDEIALVMPTSVVSFRPFSYNYKIEHDAINQCSHNMEAKIYNSFTKIYLTPQFLILDRRFGLQTFDYRCIDSITLVKQPFLAKSYQQAYIIQTNTNKKIFFGSRKRYVNFSALTRVINQFTSNVQVIDENI